MTAAKDANGAQDGVLQHFDVALTGFSLLWAAFWGYLVVAAAFGQEGGDLILLLLTGVAFGALGVMSAIAGIRLIKERQNEKNR